MSVLLRPATEADRKEVGDILHDFLDETPWMPKLYNRQKTRNFCGTMIGRGWVTLAEVDGQPQAFLARDQQDIHALYVKRPMCGQGIGHRLLRDAQMQELALELWTFQFNEAAQRFYLREGFKEVERTDGYGNDEKLPDIRYRWERGSL
ncbi:MAG: GNAT family N-acetyltransferase [Cognatishimia sp.]|uniref:GNAT family N-acetyltransferase n=1 Tax=Cognatishimia sp. TaxID=2211648 RepID=UPI003B8C52DA